MGEILQFTQKPKAPAIYCDRCGAYIGQGYTWGLAFYCDTCKAELDRGQGSN